MSLVFEGISINEEVGGLGLSSRRAVRVATTQNQVFTTDFASGQTIDGVTLALNDRILIKDQTTGIQKGVYEVTAGTPTRAPDFDIDDNAGSAFVFVQEGTVNEDTGWLCTNDEGADIVDTDILTWIRITGDIENGNTGVSTDNAIVRWDGTSGTKIQDSGILIDDSDNTSGGANIDITGALSMTEVSSNPTTTSAGEGSFWVRDDAPSQAIFTSDTGVDHLLAPLTTKGDLFTFSTEETRLPVGTNNLVLTADSSEATGLKWVDPETLVTGEANTGANVGSGTGASNIFRNKTGVILNFRKLVEGNAIDLTQNADTITIAVMPGSIDHDELGGLGDDDHSQYALLAGRGTSQTLQGGTTVGGSLTLESTSNATKGTVTILDPLQTKNYVEFKDITAPANAANGFGRLYKKTGDDGLFWLPDSGGSEIDLTDTGFGGETNTASNVGTGDGWFKIKSGSDLQFKSIIAGSTKLSVTNNTNDLTVDVSEANINHDNLSGFVANEHIDHSTVTLTAGIGLTGGGNIAANRTFDLDIPGLTEETSIDQNSDFLAIYDTSAGAHRKVKPDNLLKSRDYYDAIADPTGDGDFTTIAAAFTSGALTVFARDGAYTETVDIVIPDGGHLIGESIDGVIVTLTAGSSLTIDGSGGTKETTGTISITHNTTAVAGVGTTFTNLNPIGTNTFIELEQTCYLVASVTDNTNLVITETYQGATLSGSNYSAQQMFTGTLVQNLTLTGSSSDGVMIRATRHSTFSKITCDGNLLNFNIADNCNDTFDTLISLNSGGDGFNIDDTSASTLDKCQSFNSIGHGFEILGTSSNVEIIGCQGSNNNLNGININGTTTNVAIVNGIYNNNVIDGIETQPGTGTATIKGVTVRNNGLDGMDIDGTNNIIGSCVSGGNGRYGIRSGDGGTVIGCQAFENGDHGITMEADVSCQITGNYSYNNTGCGIFGDDDDSTISGNICRNNTLHGINIDGGNDNIITGNRCYDNTLNGIEISTGGDHNNMTGNHCSGNVIGINLSVGSVESVITGNTTISNSSHGIQVASNRTIIVGNRSTLNTGDGCRIVAGATDVTQLSNNFQNNTGTDFNDLGTITSGYESVLANNVGIRQGSTLTLEDSNVNELLILSEVASAVNELTISNAATSNPPIINATGSDAVIPISIQPKGATGTILLRNIRHYGALAANPVSPTPANGDKYYNTVINHEMMYDGSRSKWLSVTMLSEPFGKNGTNTVGTFYRRINGQILTSTTGAVIPKGTIVGLGYTTSVSASHTIRIYVGPGFLDVPSGGSITSFSDFTLNFDFVSSNMSTRNQAGSTTSNLQMNVYYKLRA